MILLRNHNKCFGSLLKLSKHIYFIDVYELICISCTLKGTGSRDRIHIFGQK
jgi:hypothetical protein